MHDRTFFFSAILITFYETTGQINLNTKGERSMSGLTKSLVETLESDCSLGRPEAVPLHDRR